MTASRAGVFLRPDAQIEAKVGELLTEILFADPATVRAAEHGGVGTLLGQPGSQDHHDLIPVAMRLIWEIDGVIDVVDKPAPRPHRPAAARSRRDARPGRNISACDRRHGTNGLQNGTFGPRGSAAAGRT